MSVPAKTKWLVKCGKINRKNLSFLLLEEVTWEMYFTMSFHSNIKNQLHFNLQEKLSKGFQFWLYFLFFYNVEIN